MLRFLISLNLLLQLTLISANLYAGSAYYYEYCPGCGGSEEHHYSISTPTPSFEGSQRNCHTEEYVCGQTCWDGSYDGDRSRQGMGYCIDKICTRTVCE
ncbi:MAG: hypothetical protein ACK4TF_07145 [Thermodesulfovibrionales bacterium]